MMHVSTFPFLSFYLENGITVHRPGLCGKDADSDIPILKEAQGGVRGAAIVKLGTPFLLHRSAIKLTNVNCSS